MKITKQVNGSALVISLEGRLDTVTSPDLESFMNNNLDGVTDLTLDFKDLEYISSAGLRVLMMLQKAMWKCGGKMKVTSPNEMVQEVFDATGFSDILEIE